MTDTNTAMSPSELRDALIRNEEIAALREQMVDLAQRLKPAQVKFANYVVSGMSHIDAYIQVKKDAKDPKIPSRANASNQGRKWLEHEVIATYVEKGREMTLVAALKKAEYDESAWMQTQLRILAQSLGDIPVQKVIVHEGVAYNMTLNESNMSQANKAQELLAKRHGWLQDNVNAKVSGRTVLDFRKVDLTGAKNQTKALNKLEVDSEAADLNDE